MDTALGIQSWQLSPVDVFDVPAPPMWKTTKQADWDRARVQHVALATAAGIEPVRKMLLLTDGCRGQLNIRWIERYGRIPDGPRVGQRLHMWPFQRDIIRGIYCQPEYWQAVDAVLKQKRAEQRAAGGGNNAP